MAPGSTRQAPVVGSSAPPPPPFCNVSSDLEQSLTQVARAILRLEVPKSALMPGESIDRAGYWLLVRVSAEGSVRLSDLADSVALDLSTVSRQMGNLVASGLVTKDPDPLDGRASLLSLSPRGQAVLAAVSEARRLVLAEAVAEWTEDERNALAHGLLRLEAGLQQTKGHTTDHPQMKDDAS
jgi:DNA-binding MarR family transcriptional regulator